MKILLRAIYVLLFMPMCIIAMLVQLPVLCIMFIFTGKDPLSYNPLQGFIKDHFKL